jgi:hypothetical protein
MPSFLGSGVDWLNSVMNEEPVTYTQGATDIAMNATFGQTNYESIDNSGVATSHVARDFIVAVSDMIDDSDAAVLPRKNDTIAATINGVAGVFQVLELQGRCYSIDQTGSMMRIHTKAIG